jgi:hypothetical protein
LQDDKARKIGITRPELAGVVALSDIGQVTRKGAAVEPRRGGTLNLARA